MFQRLMTAGALAGALLLAPIGDRPASALVGSSTALKSAGDSPALTTQVRRGFSGSGFRGFRGSGFRGFSGSRFSGFRAGPRFYGFRGNRGVRTGIGFGNRHFRPGWRHGWKHHRRWRHRGWYPGIYAAPFVGYGYYGYSSYNSCSWLKRRAVYTGSHYWWRRYQACRYGY